MAREGSNLEGSTESPASRKSKGRKASETFKLVKAPKIEYRFGIGEWYGRSFVHLDGEQRRAFAAIQLRPKNDQPKQPCPFLSRPGRPVDCHKPGGICSLRSYQREGQDGGVVADARRSSLVTICPSRFEQEGTIYEWINEVILPGRNTIDIGETPFLRRVPKVGQDKPSQRKAGRIDNVLVVPGSSPLDWIPIEKQAVYFSGKKMSLDFEAMSRIESDSIPFPVIRRRPDFRSSSAKRLLPQLEIKIKELRNWAKKTAVVVDEDFYSEFGPMVEEAHISTAHLVWFVVKYELENDHFALKRSHSHMVKLEPSIEAVIAAKPIPQPEFEATIQKKLQLKQSSAGS